MFLNECIVRRLGYDSRLWKFTLNALTIVVCHVASYQKCEIILATMLESYMMCFCEQTVIFYSFCYMFNFTLALWNELIERFYINVWINFHKSA